MEDPSVHIAADLQIYIIKMLDVFGGVLTDRHNRRRVLDSLLLAAALAAPAATAALTGCTDALADGLERLFKLTAAAAMPEAGIETALILSDEQVATHPSDDSDLYFISPSETLQSETGDMPAETEPPAFSPRDTSADEELAEAAVPPENRGPIEQTQYLSTVTGDSYVNEGNACIRNATEYDNSEVRQAAAAGMPFTVEINSSEPQVLIMHTHSTESYDRFDAGFYDVNYPYRSTDSQLNVVAVGEVMAEELNALGINTVHACEYHDYPSYNNSYSRSRETVLKYLEQYPSIKIVIDVHRDGLETSEGLRIKPVAEIDGYKAAQIMIVAGAGDSDDAVPEFRKNLAFASSLQDKVQTMYPGLARPLYFAYRHYNQDLTTGSILIEVGSHANTLDEAKYAVQLTARALAELLKSSGAEG